MLQKEWKVMFQNMRCSAKFSPDWVFVDGIVKKQDVETEDSHQQRMKSWHSPEMKKNPKQTAVMIYSCMTKVCSDIMRLISMQKESLFIRGALELLSEGLALKHSQWIDWLPIRAAHTFWPIKTRRLNNSEGSGRAAHGPSQSLRQQDSPTVLSNQPVQPNL